ncbi:MAG: ribbon-helix-helix protein, CopG family [Candidatus Thiodiazotropha sp. (ex Codakia rugifera)]|nr:ribbon-helix-helix protein, CopG family [Candidatus Thiodiazotropha sp. (ex Codakia rugifera)]
MAETKSTTLTVRVHPEVKEGLRAVAEKERRSLANMIEVMIRQYCDHSGVHIPEVATNQGK